MLISFTVGLLNDWNGAEIVVTSSSARALVAADAMTRIEASKSGFDAFRSMSFRSDSF